MSEHFQEKTFFFFFKSTRGKSLSISIPSKRKKTHQLLEQRDHRHGIGRGDHGAEYHAQAPAPVEAQDELDEHGRQARAEDNPGEGQEDDLPEGAPRTKHVYRYAWVGGENDRRPPPVSCVRVRNIEEGNEESITVFVVHTQAMY